MIIIIIIYKIQSIIQLPWYFAYFQLLDCWLCGTQDKGETPSAFQPQKLGIEDITLVFAVGDSDGMAMYCIKFITNFPILGTRKHRRPGNPWSEYVKTDVSNCGLAGVDPQVGDVWGAGVRHNLVLLTP